MREKFHSLLLALDSADVLVMHFSVASRKLQLLEPTAKAEHFLHSTAPDLHPHPACHITTFHPTKHDNRSAPPPCWLRHVPSYNARHLNCTPSLFVTSPCFILQSTYLICTPTLLHHVSSNKARRLISPPPC